MTVWKTPSVHRPNMDLTGQTVLEERRPIVRLVERRSFLRGVLGLSAVTLLPGCDISNQQNLRTALRAMSRWNDLVQAWIFDPNVMAPTYTDADVLRPPRYNAFYPKEQVKPIDGETWRLELAGLVNDRQSWDCLLYTSPSPRDGLLSRMPSSA